MVEVKKKTQCVKHFLHLIHFFYVPSDRCDGLVLRSGAVRGSMCGIQERDDGMLRKLSYVKRKKFYVKRKKIYVASILNNFYPPSDGQFTRMIRQAIRTDR